MESVLLVIGGGQGDVGGNVVVVVLIVAVALIFDFCNGFHDSANSIATLVATRVLSPHYAVIWAAFFNFAAVFLLGLKVAGTIANDIIDPHAASTMVVFSALFGAIAWDLITWRVGIPSSSSHALIGGFLGGGLAVGGPSVVNWGGLTMPILGIVLAPSLCLGMGYLLMLSLLWICRNHHAGRVNNLFKKLQFVAAAIYSISHGANDAQKTIGIIAALLVGERLLIPRGSTMTPEEIPFWIVILAFMAITLGTLSGGWRIVKTMGSGITKLGPVDGFAAATAGGVLIMGFTEIGLPVSTTHSIAGSIMGVGATKRLSAVRWGVSGRIVCAWVLTIPVSAALAVLCYWVTALCVKTYGWLS